jgi:hypothetical protein
MANSEPPVAQFVFDNPDDARPLPILKRGVAVYEERSIPVLVLDTRARPDLDNLTRFHNLQPTGEVKTAWYTPANDPRAVGLVLQFVSPDQCMATIEFDILEDAPVLYRIIESECFWFYPGRPGETYKADPGRDHILVEVPSKHVVEQWRHALTAAVETDAIAQGMNEREAREHVRRTLERLKHIGGA